jgi:hypothetical protein
VRCLLAHTQFSSAAALALGAVLFATGPNSAEEPLSCEALWQKPSHFADSFTTSTYGEAAPVPRQTPRLQLFGTPAGFLTDPLSVMGDDDDAQSGDPADGPETNNIQVSIGRDNPWFDLLRTPGMPGGLGFYQAYFQMQLVEATRTSVCLNMQALTPAGMQWGGVDNGPTVLSPSLAWFQELGAGSALQGFVGKQFRAGSRWADGLENGFRYGMGVQCPLPGLRPPGERNLFMFVQALGWYNSPYDPRPGQQMTWEIVPGIHWRLADNCWLSVGHSRQGMITCSWQY